MERFGEKIRDHVFGGAVSHFDPSLFDLVCDIEVLDVEVARALAGGTLVVDLQTL